LHVALISERVAQTFSPKVPSSRIIRATQPTVGHATRITGWSKKTDTLCFVRLNSSNIGRFSNLFHCQNQESGELCNNTVTKDPTTPQVCRYTTL